jgi:hypothetical protein
MRAWIRFYRPALVARNAADAAATSGWMHRYVFVKKDGSGPRTEITSTITTIQKWYAGGKWATAHVFRAMQATRSQYLGITPDQNRAMCAGRQHTAAAAERFYQKVNRDK